MHQFDASSMARSRLGSLTVAAERARTMIERRRATPRHWLRRDARGHGTAGAVAVIGDLPRRRLSNPSRNRSMQALRPLMLGVVLQPDLCGHATAAARRSRKADAKTKKDHAGQHRRQRRLSRGGRARRAVRRAEAAPARAGRPAGQGRQGRQDLRRRAAAARARRSGWPKSTSCGPPSPGCARPAKRSTPTCTSASTKDYLVATACDQIIMPAVGLADDHRHAGRGDCSSRVCSTSWASRPTSSRSATSRGPPSR